MISPSTMLKKLKKHAMIWSEHNHFCTIKYFMSNTKDLQISTLARALLYKVDPCEYQSPGIGMHLSDVATMGKYFYQTDWLIDSDCESCVKLIKISLLYCLYWKMSTFTETFVSLKITMCQKSVILIENYFLCCSVWPFF